MAKKKKEVEPQEIEKIRQNPTLERMVLGAIIAGHKQVREVIDALNVDDFFHEDHRKIWRAIHALQEDKEEISLIRIYTQLEQLGEMSSENLIAFLGEIGKESQGLNYLTDAVRELRRLTMCRVTSHILETAKLAVAEMEDIHDVIDTSIDRLSETLRRFEEFENQGITYRKAAEQMINELLSAEENVKILSGVAKLDEMIGGFRPGELVIITAETGTGKTLLAQQIRKRACQSGYVSLFCSGEMWAKHLLRRELAAECGINPSLMRNEKEVERFLAPLIEAASHQCEKCRILDGELAIGKIRRVARSLKAKGRLDLLVLDYDELIDAPGKDENEQLRRLVRMAKSIGMELNCAVLLISQLRKEYGNAIRNADDGRPPSLNRLYGSGAKIKHASIIVLAERKWEENLLGVETQAALWVLKNRDGRTGRVDAMFNIRTLRFESVNEKQVAYVAS